MPFVHPDNGNSDNRNFEKLANKASIAAKSFFHGCTLTITTKIVPLHDS